MTSNQSTIYVALKGEGTLAWRPVSAIPQADGTWLLLGSVPDDEQWEFAPGMVVRCVEHLFQNGERSLVAAEAAMPNPAVNTDLARKAAQ
jgi:hypothetical protein